MKKIILALLIFSSSLFSLEWVKDLDTAVVQAQKENKTLMVMVSGKHCGWCKKMQRRTLEDPSVQKRLEKFVVLKVMREDLEFMEDLPQITAIPTIFFMKADKEVLQSVIGYFNVMDFTSYIGEVEKKALKMKEG